MRRYFILSGIFWLLALWAIVPALGQLAPNPAAISNPENATTRQAAVISLSASDFASANALLGQRVSDIQFRGIEFSERVLPRMQALVMQRPGQPLDRQKIRASIEALYGTGKFANLQAEAQQAPHGEVSLVFRGTPNYFVGSVTAEGAPKRPTDTQLTDASKLQLGEMFTEQKGAQAVIRIKAVLADNGFYQATVTYTESRQNDTQLTDITFHIQTGPMARIGEVRVTEDSGYTGKQVADIAKLKAGKPATSSTLSAGLARLRSKLTKQDHLEAQISVVDRMFHKESNTVDYEFKIERGPRVTVEVVGMKIRRGKLKKYVPIFEEHAVDDDLLNEGRRNLRDYLQTQGYFDAEVNYRKEPKDANHVGVVYTIERSSRQDVAEVFVEGNHYLSTEFALRPILLVQKESTVLPHGRFSQQLAAQDVENIKNQYRLSGYQQVQVQYEVKDDFENKANKIAVYYRIVEGPQTMVASVTIEGASAANRERFPQLSIVEGEPYAQANVDSDRSSILTCYYNSGYPNADLEATSIAATGEPNRMSVTYKITEGGQVFVDRVIRAHLTYTRPKYVMREVQINPGDPLSQQKIYDTQSRLYSLGVFNAVDIAVKNPNGDEQYKDVLLQLQEAKRWTFDYGIGIEASTGQPSTPTTTTNSSGQTVNTTSNPGGETGVSPRVSFDVTRLNFLGKTNTIAFKSQYGKLEKLGLIRFNAPRLFDNPDLTFAITAFYDDAINVTTFTSERLEGSVGLTQVVSRRFSGAPVTTLDYRFTYRRVKASNVVVAPEEIPVLSQPVRVGIPSFTYARDKRNDPIDASNGNFTTVDLGVASKYFGSQADFGRVVAQNSTYVMFRKKPNTKTGWVFARTLRLGLAEPFNDTIIPLPERFLAGGANSLRGFALNQAGPRDLTTGAPLGGSSLILNSLELRFPPFALPFFGETISMVAFNDVGNVFSDNTTMFKSLFRFYQPNRSACQAQSTEQQCRFDYMSNTLGAGIRYKTPIGPVRFDLGYNLNPPAYPYFSADSGGNLTVFNTQVTRRWNFFFSIGQAF